MPRKSSIKVIIANVHLSGDVIYLNAQEGGSGNILTLKNSTNKRMHKLL